MKTKKLIGVIALLTIAGVLATPVFAQKSQTNAVTEDEIHWLNYIREEEKLARDVYLTLFDQWGLRIFQNIAASEQIHTDKVRLLLDKYGLPDPAEGNGIGEFDNQELKDLYKILISKGVTSKVDALEVGMIIEETDISDLNTAIADASHRDISNVYSNLLEGSLNHLAAFQSQLLKY